MFRFEHIEYLYALGIIPVLIAFFWTMWIARKRVLARFAQTPMLRKLMPQMSRYKHTLKFILLIFGLAFLIVGWSNPQWGTKKEKVKRKSVDLFIALDISRSMLAQDIAPNRLERSRKFAQTLVNQLKGERIGSIIFAGNAYLQVPLTTDYAALELFIKSANTDMAPNQGTAIVDAIDLAEQSFDEENKNHKALIIITDGENHDEEALERARQANANGLLIYTVGVGTVEGSFIPTFIGGRADFKRDEGGNPVRSSLNEKMLEDLASEGDGQYFNLINAENFIAEALRKKIDGLEKRELEQRVFSEFESYFQYFLAVALLLIVIEFFISYRKNRYLADKDIFKV
ncbi:MAG: VWA domain-containing protein [Saprospiraceae bacterium]|nr:VWA domain-containing protein [Saprospiraceae bacterium]